MQQIQDKTERMGFYKSRLFQTSTGKFMIKCPILTKPMFPRTRTVKTENYFSRTYCAS